MKKAEGKFVTHSGVFHADDVIAFAILLLCVRYVSWFYKGFTLVRTRDAKTIADGDIVFDVGGEHTLPKFVGEDERYALDHHQKGGAGVRPNGIPYAAAGLTWRAFGAALVHHMLGGGEENALTAFNVAERIDERFVAPIDAADNGVELCDTTKPVSPLTLSGVIASFNVNWNDSVQTPGVVDGRFNDVTHNIALPALEAAIDNAIAYTKAEGVVMGSEGAIDGKVLVLPRFCPWQEIVCAAPAFDQCLYVVFEQNAAASRQWMVQAIPDSPGGFGKRKPFPAEWGGLPADHLATLTGVPDAVFCHIGLWICAAKSRNGALALAKLAVKAKPPAPDAACPATWDGDHVK